MINKRAILILVLLLFLFPAACGDNSVRLDTKIEGLWGQYI